MQENLTDLEEIMALADEYFEMGTVGEYWTESMKEYGRQCNEARDKLKQAIDAQATEIAALKKENEAFKAVTTTWTGAANDFRDAVLHGLDGLDNDQTNTVLSEFDAFLPI